MEKKVNKKYELIGKIESYNKGENFKNITICLENDERINIKIEDYNKDNLVIGKIYTFYALGALKNEDEVILKLLDAVEIEDVKSGIELENIYKSFYRYAPLSLTEMQKEIENNLDSIKNEIIKNITKKLYNQNKNSFYTHPAGTKFHHAYVGGLAYHTLCMIRLIPPFLIAYPYLNADLLVAGALLHDMGKITEMTGVDGEYTTEGLLIGHLVKGALDIEKAALELGYIGKEETMLLEHMVISHHGQYNFGSPKKPQIPEALLLWYLDAIDSKFTVLGDELENVSEGEWTSMISVLDKMKFYKGKIK